MDRALREFKSNIHRVPPATATRVADMIEWASDTLRTNPDEPKDWPDADKLRMVALELYQRDWENGVFDEDDMQADLFRIANELEDRHE